MTLRRLALAITLLTATVQADYVAPDDWAVPADKDEQGSDDLVVWRDGKIAGSVRGYVPWTLLRLVMPDLGPVRDPVWIEGVRESTQHHGGDLTLSALQGAAITGPSGEFIGLVRRCLVGVEAGRVLAVELESGEVLPWSTLIVPENASRPLVLRTTIDLHA